MKKILAILFAIILSMILFYIEIEEDEVADSEPVSSQSSEELLVVEEEIEIIEEEQIIIIIDEQYPVAATIWNYLRDKGFNDYVIAGIIGNMMQEAGSKTLRIDPAALNPGLSYGICQWDWKYHREAWGMSLEEQLDYLYLTLGKEINMFGRNYYYGFTFDDFLNLQDEQEAASAYLRCYGRGETQTEQIRRNNATYAYNHFIGEA